MDALDRGQGVGICYKYDLVIKELKSLMVCALVMVLISWASKESQQIFPSRTKWSSEWHSQHTLHEVPFTFWRRATNWILSVCAAEAGDSHSLLQGPENLSLTDQIVHIFSVVGHIHTFLLHFLFFFVVLFCFSQPLACRPYKNTLWARFDHRLLISAR